MSATASLVIPRPDDWHVHVRDGAMLKAVLPWTARNFARAIIMPNLKAPVTETAAARQYRQAIMDALPPGADFQPLMTAYLTDATDPNDLEAGFKDGILTAAKLYPANATTNSSHGVTDIKKLYPALERMQTLGMPLLVHGEVTDPAVDIFDREAMFIERVMIPLRHDFPALKVVFEHVTTKEAADYVRETGTTSPTAATITAHHLRINRNAIFKGGVRPHFYCLPIAKREEHREALVKAATSGAPMFFLGTDTAPHPRNTKECACGCAGIFTAINALEIYAQVFDDAGALDKLEAFACRNGPAFYGLPVNVKKVRLEKMADAPEALKPILTADGAEITPFDDGAPIMWRASPEA